MLLLHDEEAKVTGIVEDFGLGLIRGLGMIGEACAGLVNWLLNDLLGLGAPSWVGKIAVICVTALTIWKLQKALPKYILIVTIIAACFIVFGSYF